MGCKLNGGDMRAIYRCDGTIKLCGDYPEDITAEITQEQEDNKCLYRVNPNTKEVYPAPVCDPKYTKIIDNVILEMTSEEKADVDAAEAAILARQARAIAKSQAIADNLPSWSTIETAIGSADTIAKLRAVVLKLARVLYWDVKNSAV
jgi:hypothetical protein